MLEMLDLSSSNLADAIEQFNAKEKLDMLN